MKVRILKEAKQGSQNKTVGAPQTLKRGDILKVELMWETSNHMLLCRCESSDGKTLLDLPCFKTLEVIEKEPAPQFGNDSVKVFWSLLNKSSII